MAAYRFYFLDKNGAVAGYEEMDCPDDETAVSKAAELRPASAPEYTIIEVWQANRLVHRRDQVASDHHDKGP